MTTQFNRTKKQFQFLSIVGEITLPLAFLVFMVSFFPYRERFEMDLDEGLNLIKSLLVVRRYPLYEQIWSDQPPLFTYLIAFGFRFYARVFQTYGFDVNVARFIVLLLSCLLLWGTYKMLRRVWGTPHALAGGLLFFVLPAYLKLSVSVMVGLPALTLAVLSLLALVTWHQQNKYRWLALSACLLALSVLTKIFTGFLAPIYVVGIFISGYGRLREKFSFRGLFGASLLWLAVFVTTTALLSLFLIKPDNLPQLLETHFSANRLELFPDPTYTITWHLRNAGTIVYLAIIGALFGLVEKRWLSFYPFAWMVSAYLLLTQHTPVWYHHQLLVTIPAVILAGSATGETARRIPDLIRFRDFTNPVNLLTAGTMLGVALLAFDRTPKVINQLRESPTMKPESAEAVFLRRIEKYASQTHWMVTDMPMFAFRTGLPVVPDLAVISSKRLLTGSLTEEQILSSLRNYQPELILLGRFQYRSLDGYLNANYRLIHTRFDQRLYARNDVQEEPGGD